MAIRFDVELKPHRGIGRLQAFDRAAETVDAPYVAGCPAVLECRLFKEVELEEAWAQTRTLPAGFQVRAGRFSSQLGYLNEQHPHTDDFIERPLLYRAFLGGHYFDDGVRVNWTAPTDLYLLGRYRKDFPEHFSKESAPR